MPVNRVNRSGNMYGFRWGNTGKVYSVRKYGEKGAYERSLRQGRAIQASKSFYKKYDIPKSIFKSRRK
jgi:hypothetical protein